MDRLIRISILVATVLAVSLLSPAASAGTASSSRARSSITTTTVSPSGQVTTATFPALTSPFASIARTRPRPARADSPPPGSGTITVVLDPSTRRALHHPVRKHDRHHPSITPSALPASARPVIRCKVDLRQLVHYSKYPKDVSWHWTWKCDDEVSLSAGSVLHARAFGVFYPIASGSSFQSGAEGDVNVRTKECIDNLWYGKASGTFSAPNHLSRTFEGTSQTHVVKCP